ncbi:AAA family ATPase [Oribacterium sp. WCC10]|uniref:AAA family ATPase n=1 Tax=Oribacterium sp. WCC10 TaxID=1855343 RepID=UPI0008E45E54|nr:AAA family ATPase [Oribacterium sp. WCC10]SFG54232.1 ATPase family associated with various cellular activities (AAA) [Oribacterium sp. WCC10]
MRALTIFIDEQWLAAISEKDMSVPSEMIAQDMVEQLPVKVQYLGVTKTTYLYDEAELDEEKAVYYLRQILQNRFDMSYDVQEAIVNYRISSVPTEEAEDEEDADTDDEKTDNKPAVNESEKKRPTHKRMRTAPDTSSKDDEEPDTEPITVGEEGGNAGGKQSKKGKETDTSKQKKKDKKLGQDPISFGNKRDDSKDVAPTLQKIKQLKGSDSLIGLCERLNRMAPALQSEEFIDVLEDRAYLFSVEQDIGINARVSMFFDFLQDEQLLPSEYGGCEIQLACGRSVGLPLAMAKQFIAQTEASMFCMDISSWIGQIDDPEFRDFLLFLYSQKDMYRFVFRIPYVEKKVLNQVADVIGDIFTVEIVTLPPLNQKLLEETAISQLENYGYTITEGALKLFRDRIAEEKSDGRFYGMNTIGKIVKEMVLKKLEKSIDTGEKVGETKEKRKGRSSSKETDSDECRTYEKITERDISDLGFRHDHDTSPEDELSDMIGVTEVRSQMKKLVEEMISSGKPKNIRFIGNPGTGRTVIARILGEILREKGILKKGEIIEHSMKDLMGTVPGETVPKTLSICRDATDSVLFIDEPYPEIKEMVAEPEDTGEDYDDHDDENVPDYDFHKEALETLVSEMEANKNILVVFALTEEELEKVRMDAPDIDSAMPCEVEFKDFSRTELGEIFLRMVRRNKFQLEDGLDKEIMNYFDELPEKVTKSGKFTNARYVRNLFDRTWSKTLLRSEIDHDNGRKITRQDFRLAAAESAEILNKKEPRKYPLGFRLQSDD